MNFRFLSIFIFIIPFLSAIEMSVWPQELDIEVENEREYCYNVTIKSSESIKMRVRDIWSLKENSRQINEYTLMSDSVESNIKLFYLEELESSEINTHTFCIKTLKPGRYYGALIYSREDNALAMGLWLKIKTLPEENPVWRITGKIVEEYDEKTTMGIISGVVLTIMVLLLWIFTRKRIYS
jgi:hypothetical protein